MERTSHKSELSRAIRKNRHLTQSQKTVLTLIMLLDHPLRGCFATNKYFQEETGLSRRTIQYAIKFLLQEGYVTQIMENNNIRVLRVITKRIAAEQTTFHQLQQEIIGQSEEVIYTEDGLFYNGEFFPKITDYEKEEVSTANAPETESPFTEETIYFP